jgi:hypothetical protein
VIERKIKLTGLIRDPGTRPGILIAAIAEMNRMEGSYAPARIETDSRSVTIKRIIVHEPYAPGEAEIKPYEELPALRELDEEGDFHLNLHLPERAYHLKPASSPCRQAPRAVKPASSRTGSTARYAAGARGITWWGQRRFLCWS